MKLGLRVSPRTVRHYMPEGIGRTRRGASAHRWRTFLRNHASVLFACDFCVVVTARLRVIYVFVVMKIGSRRLVHVNVTSHPTAAWTLQPDFDRSSYISRGGFQSIQGLRARFRPKVLVHGSQDTR